MKKFITTTVLLLLLFCQCRRNENGFKTHSIETRSFTSGTWRVSNLVVNGTSENERYANDNFQFSITNSIIINHQSNIFKGEWCVTGTDATADALPVDRNFIIDMKSPLFKDLNGKWQIVDRDMSTLSLIRTCLDAQGLKDSLVISKR